MVARRFLGGPVGCSQALVSLFIAASIVAGCEPTSDARAPVSPGAEVGAPSPVEPPGSLPQPKSTSNVIATAPPAAASAAPVVSASPSPAPAPDATTAPDPDEAAALAQMSDTQRAVLLAVKACVESGLRKNEAPKGSMAVELTVAADGTVASQKLADGYPPAIRACVEGRVHAIQFPKGAAMRVFRFPINETSQPAQ